MREPLRVRIPGDKSITHRALLLAAIARGESRVRSPLAAGDTSSTAAVLRELGAVVPSLQTGEVRVQGLGLRGLHAPAGELDCGNSGTTARLLLGMLAAQPLTATLTGDASLRSRPMRRVTQPLTAMGAVIREAGEADRLPLQVTGGVLRPIRYESPHASAQVKSALLLAGLCAGVPVSVREPTRSRDHTERLLRALGVPLTEVTSAEGCHDVALEPVASLSPLDLEVPGDFSAAAFLVAAALLLGRELVIENVGINPTRTGMLGVLARMGAKVEVLGARESGGEPVATLLVRGGALHGTSIGGAEVPTLIDELPMLAVLASRARGETTIRDAAELRLKESDRIGMLIANLRSLGAEVEELEDGLVVQGSERPLRGVVRTAHDHRIAMAFGVLAALPGNDIRIDHPDTAAVSYPAFWQELRGLASMPA